MFALTGWKFRYTHASSHHWLVTVSALGAVIGVVGGCGSSTPSSQVPPSLRSGSGTLRTIALQYYDDRPDISADGKHVVFISGRDNAFKAYKVTVDPATGASAPSRLTNADLGGETSVAISADGTSTIIEASQNSVPNLYLQSFDGTSAPQRLTNDQAAETSASFSPDSRLYTFVSLAPANHAPTIYVGQVPSGGASPSAAVALPQIVAGESMPVWVAVGSGYELVTQVQNTLTGASDFYKYSFTNFSDLQSGNVNRQAFVTGVHTKPLVAPAASNDTVFMAQRLSPLGSVLIAPSGNDAGTNKLAVETQPGSAALNATSVTAVTIPAYDVLTLSAPTTNNMLLTTGRIAAYCGAAGATNVAPTYGNAPLLWQNGQVTWLLPMASTTKNGAEPSRWGLAQDPCTTTFPDGTAASLDLTVASARLAPGATASDFSAVYVSTYTGDAEVRWLRYTGGTATVYRISANPAPQS